MSNAAPQIRPLDTENPFDVYVVALKRDGIIGLADAVYDSEELALEHRDVLKALPQYQQPAISIEIVKVPKVSSLEQIKEQLGINAIAQTSNQPPHAWSSLGPTF